MTSPPCPCFSSTPPQDIWCLCREDKTWNICWKHASVDQSERAFIQDRLGHISLDCVQINFLMKEKQKKMKLISPLWSLVFYKPNKTHNQRHGFGMTLQINTQLTAERLFVFVLYTNIIN